MARHPAIGMRPQRSRTQARRRRGCHGLLAALIAACGHAGRTAVSAAPAPVVSVADSLPGQHAAVDLSGAWATGSGFEPAVRQFVVHLECNYTPSFWIIEQSGDTVRAFTNPESRAQGVRAPERARPIPAEGTISGVDLTMQNASARYVLHYDSTSGHLRGTLNGAPFWAVREELVSATNCIPVP